MLKRVRDGVIANIWLKSIHVVPASLRLNQGVRHTLIDKAEAVSISLSAR